jgi:hypothetical protein
MNKEQKEILTILIENEIKSDIDYLEDCDKEQVTYWKSYIKQLKEIKKLL